MRRFFRRKRKAPVAEPEKQGKPDKGKSAIVTAKPRPIDTQPGSPLLSKLPQEIRDEIYSLVFLTTRIRRGVREANQNHPRIKFVPAPNSLALLYVCRRMKAEIGESWIGQVLFYYEDLRTMLDHLTALPEIIPKIRHMRVPGHPLKIEQGIHNIQWRLTPLLKLLPGLQLDTLHVLGHDPPEVGYETLTGLIRDSNGWKELRFIYVSSGILGFARLVLAMQRGNPHEETKYWRRPQPWIWLAFLKARDGANSDPFVRLHRSLKTRSVNAILKRENRVEVSDPLPRSIEEQRQFGLQEVTSMTRGENRFREVLVVARRGRGADYEEKEGSPFLRVDVRKAYPGHSWSWIRTTSHKDLDPPAESFIHVDSYHDREEYLCPYDYQDIKLVHSSQMSEAVTP